MIITSTHDSSWPLTLDNHLVAIAEALWQEFDEMEAEMDREDGRLRQFNYTCWENGEPVYGERVLERGH